MQDCWWGQNWHLQNNHGHFTVILCCVLCFTHSLYLLCLQPVLVPHVKSDWQCGSRASSQPCGAAAVLTNGIEPLRGVHYAFEGIQCRGSEGECEPSWWWFSKGKCTTIEKKLCSVNQHKGGSAKTHSTCYPWVALKAYRTIKCLAYTLRGLPLKNPKTTSLLGTGNMLFLSVKMETESM